MRHPFIRTLLLPALLSAVLSIPAAPVRAHGDIGMSLYDQLGGVHGIAPMAEDFADRLWNDPVLNANPSVADARRRFTKASLRFLLTEYLCDKTGGPMVYRGRDMKTAHAGLHISEKEWQAMRRDLQESMRKFSVPAEAQEDLVALIEETKKDIVTAPDAPAPTRP